MLLYIHCIDCLFVCSLLVVLFVFIFCFCLCVCCLPLFISLIFWRLNIALLGGSKYRAVGMCMHVRKFHTWMHLQFQPLEYPVLEPSLLSQQCEIAYLLQFFCCTSFIRLCLEYDFRGSNSNCDWFMLRILFCVFLAGWFYVSWGCSWFLLWPVENQDSTG